MTRLRRADWRFLLPAPPEGRYRRLALLGGTDELCDGLNAVAEGIATGLDAVEDADVVVVMAGSDVPLDSVLDRLRPSAVFHLEVDRRRSGRRSLSPGRLGRRLRRRGLTPTAWHWVVPHFEGARRHIPLDAAPALRWYLRTLQTAGSPAARVAEAGLRVLARAGAHRLAAWVPCYSVSAVRGAGRTSPVGVLAPSDAPVAMLTSGQDDGSRVVLLPFENGPAPSRVLKIPRLSSFEAHTVREQRTLAQLRDRLPPSLRHSLPEPLGVRRWNGVLVATESYAPGAPLVVSSGRFGASFTRVREDLRLAVDWLVAFHRATRVEGAGWDAACADRTACLLERARALFPAGSPAPALLEAAARAARALTGRPFPIVPLHNDLGPWNVHRDGDRITVIDWELGDRADAERLGPAATDLFYFATCWCLRVRHLRSPGAEVRGVRELFVRPEAGGRAAAAAHEEIARYAAALDIESAFLPLLLVVTWAERALERVERASVADPAGARGVENRYAGFLDVLAERAGPWFLERRWP